MKKVGTGGVGAVGDVQRALQLAHGGGEAEALEASRLLVAVAEARGAAADTPAPLYHALRLLLGAEESRMAAAQAAKAAKLLLVTEGFRRGAIAAGLPADLLRALYRLEDDVPALRELLGALQSLAWDPECVLGVVAPAEAWEADGGGGAGVVDLEEGVDGCLPVVLELLESRDEALLSLALACLANILAWADTKLLKHQDAMRTIAPSLERLFVLARSASRLHVLYAVAAIANAASHPLLAGALREKRGPRLLRVVRDHAGTSLTLGGVHLESCVAEALTKLDPGTTRPGVVEAGLPRTGRKFRFLYGQAPTVELSLSTAVCNKSVQALTCLWLFAMVYLLRSTMAATSVTEGEGER